MKALVQWVLRRSYRPALVAVACAPLPVLGSLVTPAMLVLASAHFGLQFGVATAAGGSALLFGLAALTGSDMAVYAGGGALNMFVGAVLGGVLRWGRSLSLAFQATLLLCLLVTAAISVFGPGSEAMFMPMLDNLVELVEEDATPERIEMIRAVAPMMLGFFAAGVFAQFVAALLVGYLALSHAREGVRFGEAFRALELGRVLSVFGMVLVTLGLFVPAAVVQDLRMLVLMGFLFQGLAVMHAWAHGKQWHPGLIAPVYVLFVPLVPSLTLIVLMALSAVGLLDNVFDLRAPLKA